jgi:hypothetical protein
MSGCCRIRLDDQIQCAPELLFAGSAPAGSFPNITTNITGPFTNLSPLPWSPYDPDTYGPRFDLLVTNPSSLCSFDLTITLDGPSTQGQLEPGAELQVGWVLRAGAINAALDVSPLTPADFYAPSQFYRTNTTPANERFTGGTGEKDQLRVFPPGAATLGPSDFIWLSIQTLVATAGFTVYTGATGSVIGAATGYGLQVEGVRI